MKKEELIDIEEAAPLQADKIMKDMLGVADILYSKPKLVSSVYSFEDENGSEIRSLITDVYRNDERVQRIIYFEDDSYLLINSQDNEERLHTITYCNSIPSQSLMHMLRNR